MEPGRVTSRKLNGVSSLKLLWVSWSGSWFLEVKPSKHAKQQRATAEAEAAARVAAKTGKPTRGRQHSNVGNRESLLYRPYSRRFRKVKLSKHAKQQRATAEAEATAGVAAKPLKPTPRRQHSKVGNKENFLWSI